MYNQKSQSPFWKKVEFWKKIWKFKNSIKSKILNGYIPKFNQVLRSHRSTFLPGLEEIDKLFQKLSRRQAFSYNDVLRPWPFMKVTWRSVKKIPQTYSDIPPNKKSLSASVFAWEQIQAFSYNDVLRPWPSFKVIKRSLQTFI